MNLLFIALALVVLPTTASSDFPPCPNMTPECRIKMVELKTLLDFYNTSYLPPLLEPKNVTEELCQEANRCFSNCRDALNKYNEACEKLSTQMYRVDTDCISHALWGLISRGYVDFFTTNPSLKRKAYADGKGTFLYYSCYGLKKDYDNLMDLYTIPPVVREKCNTPYDKFQTMQCETLCGYFEAKTSTMIEINQFNATKFSEYSKMCQDCIDNTCLMQPQKSAKLNLSEKAQKSEKYFYAGKKHISV